MAVIPDNWLGQLRGKAAEADSRFARDAKQRANAGKQPQSVILSPKDVSGSYNAARVLKTTLGGVLREITPQDLIAFQKNIAATQHAYKKGITARQVIDVASTKPKRYLNNKSDIDKARKEIRHALAISFHNGVMRLATNAGPDYGAKRHHVTIKFLSYGAAAAAGNKSPRQMAMWLRKEPLAYDCDCERHRYTFRYITTIGGFNAGRAENGFPKFRNPTLKGIACKHVLRVMSEIDQGAFSIVNMLERALAKAWVNTDGSNKAHIRTTQAEANKQLKSPGKEIIKTTADRKAEAEAAKQRKAARDALQGITQPPKPTAAQKKLAQAIKTGQFSQAQIEGMRKLGISDEDMAKMVKK